jgi:hypothetical protein
MCGGSGRTICRGLAAAQGRPKGGTSASAPDGGPDPTMLPSAGEPDDRRVHRLSRAGAPSVAVHNSSRLPWLFCRAATGSPPCAVWPPGFHSVPAGGAVLIFSKHTSSTRGGPFPTARCPRTARSNCSGYNAVPHFLVSAPSVALPPHPRDMLFPEIFPIRQPGGFPSCCLSRAARTNTLRPRA